MNTLALPDAPKIIIRPACHGIDHTALLDGLQQQDQSGVRKTHHIDGRYENIYLTEKEVPALAALSACALEHARSLVTQPIHQVGCWFNVMPPGARTSKHDHNDGDELLSGVYYVSVPKNSGDLLIFNQNTVHHHQPTEGEFVFFAPQVVHEVQTNHSADMRLSIAFNFLGKEAE